MGYRFYFGRLSKENHTKYNNMSLKELIKLKGEVEDNYLGVYTIPDETIFEFGKYHSVENEDNYFSPVFGNKEVTKYLTEGHPFFKVGRNFVKVCIDYSHNKVNEYYSKWDHLFTEKLRPTLKDCSEKDLLNMFDDFIFEYKEWKNKYNVLPYDLDLENNSLVSSWQYKYTTFDLVNIYKNFDWDNNYLIYYAW